MEENQNEEEVLLVADKDDDGKLKAVDKSAAKEGIWRLLLPSMENLDLRGLFSQFQASVPATHRLSFLPYSRLLAGYAGRIYRHAPASRRQQGFHRPVQDQSE